MLKVFGMILTVTAFTLTGFSYAKNVTLRIDQLNEIKKIIVMLEGELRYGNSTIEEALETISSRVSLVFAEFFEKTSQLLKENSGESLADLWRKNVNEMLDETKLNAKDLEEFSQMGECLGYLDLKAQSESLALYKDRLALKLDELNENCAKRIKMYRSLGVSMGILTAIILL